MKNILPIKSIQYMENIQPIENIQSFKIIQPLKTIQGFRTIIGDIFRSDAFRGDTCFSSPKNSYISVLSHERTCSPDYFLAKNIVFQQPSFHVIDT